MTTQADVAAIGLKAVAVYDAQVEVERLDDERGSCVCDIEREEHREREIAAREAWEPHSAAEPCWKSRRYVGPEGDPERYPVEKWCAACLLREEKHLALRAAAKRLGILRRSLRLTCRSLRAMPSALLPPELRVPASITEAEGEGKGR